MIHIKTEAEIAKMRAAGLVVSAALEAMRAAIEPGVATADLDAIAARVIRDAGATSNFKGYRGGAGGQVPYPATICASVNDEVVHGVPDRRHVLREGDIISIDCGAVLDGWHGDAAFTVGVGAIDPAIQRMLDTCEESMWRGIGAGVAGGRLGDIGYAVESYVHSQGSYGIVEEYGGHGIGTQMHQEPHVPNLGRRGKGLTLQPGLTLAVEPMIMMGKRHLVTLDDDWTVVTVDHSWAAHFEHTFAVTAQGPQVLTAPDLGVARLAAIGAAVGV
ncbi:MAG TPA: type I methionyl aminopeptidase [Acidothermaceae bacterium]|jgi:methionyl aminopeptidase|nr:type I methionyl aminopeptidase [Acidothermaceae bacterium]